MLNAHKQAKEEADDSERGRKKEMLLSYCPEDYLTCRYFFGAH